ncbi:MAG: ATP-binding protein, partial [Armatimonadetes bacterium]|nr:ATP-binding protein [Armatimonadota bacterium]
MGNIRILDKSVAERIAAGEVVERPASAVKELVENSLDAGATQIVIAIEGAGSTLIRVGDNGSGMQAADLRLCVARFATSKIRTLDDLESAGAFGFRGEALPSIAAVSHLEIVTAALGS